MPEHLVSVIIPTFNRAYCVGKAIESARAQTHRNTEILVLDDGSTDGTGDFIEQSYAHDPRVRYFFHENRGVTATRNLGITLCRGDFVALLDSDDTWSPWKLDVQLACLRQRPELGMVWTDMQAVGPGGAVLSESYLQTMYHAYRWFSRDELFPRSFPLAEIAPALAPIVEDRRLYTGEIFSQMIMGNLVHTSTVLVRRERLEKVGGFNEELRIAGEDYDFHLRTCKEGPVGFLDLPTIRYQTGMADRLTRDEYKIHAAINCLKTVLPYMERGRSQINLSDRMIEMRLAAMHKWVGDVLLNAGQARQARVHLRTSLRHEPWQPSAWKALALASLPGGIRQPLRWMVRELKFKLGGRTDGQAARGRGGRLKAGGFLEHLISPWKGSRRC
jgi:glycosyltransferase involved in cell wall biosynthesis